MARSSRCTNWAGGSSSPARMLAAVGQGRRHPRVPSAASAVTGARRPPCGRRRRRPSRPRGAPRTTSARRRPRRGSAAAGASSVSGWGCWARRRRPWRSTGHDVAYAGRRGRGEQPARALQVHPGGSVGSAALAQDEGQVHDLVHALQQRREVDLGEVEPVGLDPVAVGGDRVTGRGPRPAHQGSASTSGRTRRPSPPAAPVTTTVFTSGAGGLWPSPAYHACRERAERAPDHGPQAARRRREHPTMLLGRGTVGPALTTRWCPSERLRSTR